MSNSLAIAAVTATLRSLLAAGLVTVTDLNDAQVTAQPLDKARDATATVNQVNLFLYLISPNAAWRNQDMPWPCAAWRGGQPTAGAQPVLPAQRLRAR